MIKMHDQMHDRNRTQKSVADTQSKERDRVFLGEIYLNFFR